MQKYSFDLVCNEESRKLVLTRATEESEQHLAMKLVAYLLFFDRRLKVEAGVDQHYKPDLVRTDGRDVTLWVDCGQISIHKLDKIATTNHAADIVVVKPTRRSAESHRRQAQKRVRRMERVSYVMFDDGFVDALAAALSTRTGLHATLEGEMLEMRVNETRLATRIHRL
jgi:uncharacterized protein YaeQ